MNLTTEQQASFVEFGRIISCDDPEVMRQLSLGVSDPQTWLDEHRKNAGPGCCCGICMDDPVSWDDVESAYPKLMIQVVEPYLIGFWNNMGDLTAWVMGCARKRSIALDADMIRNDLRGVEEGEFNHKWEFVEAATGAVYDALRHQEMDLFFVPDPYEDPVYACVVSPLDAARLGQCESWADGAELFN